MNERRRVAAAGVAALAVYVALAATSALISPLAGRPLLDGFSPQPYKWVSPPPDLASTNTVPKPSDFSLLVRNGHVPADTLPTSDGQVIVITPADFAKPPAGTKTIALKVIPSDPAKFAAPGNGLIVLGNVYRIQASFEPSGTPLGSLTSPLEVVLSYPASVGAALDRTVVISTDGTTWTTVDSKESPLLRQIEGPVAHLGYVAVAGPPTSATSSRSIWPIVAVGVVAAMLIAAGLALAVRRRSPT